MEFAIYLATIISQNVQLNVVLCLWDSYKVDFGFIHLIPTLKQSRMNKKKYSRWSFTQYP